MVDKQKDNESPLNKIKEGVSVKEIESFARKYIIEGFLILALIIATLSSAFNFFTGPGWSVIFTGIGGIVSVAFPDHVMKIGRPLFNFLKKQEKTIQIIIGIVRLIFAIFIPFLLFLEIGLLAGLAFHQNSKITFEKKEEDKEEETPDTDEEHI
jgi:hypothetical protein